MQFFFAMIKLLSTKKYYSSKTIILIILVRIKFNTNFDRIEILKQKALKNIPLAFDFEKIEILYEDEDIIAVSKPPYIATMPKHRYEAGSLYSRVFGYLKKEPYGLHRLDMNTSGVVIFGKNSSTAKFMNNEFRYD